jgi:ribulose-phosphate 3-epimerase
MNARISPSILSADLSELGNQLKICEQAGADAIHIDVMDGVFVPNITFGPNIVEMCRQITSLPIDVHLMIVEPEKHLKSFANAGANRITVHYETCPHIHRTLQTLQELGVTPGVTINPGTPIEVLIDLIGSFEQVLVMTVNPGFGGQSFIPNSLNRIQRLKTMLETNKSNAVIQVDGGIDENNIYEIYMSGARDFVAGTSIFKHPEGIETAILNFRLALSSVK